MVCAGSMSLYKTEHFQRNQRLFCFHTKQAWLMTIIHFSCIGLVSPRTQICPLELGPSVILIAKQNINSDIKKPDCNTDRLFIQRHDVTWSDIHYLPPYHSPAVSYLKVPYIPFMAVTPSLALYSGQTNGKNKILSKVTTALYPW